MRAYIQKGFKDGIPVAYCIHQTISGFPRQPIMHSVMMKMWETKDRQGKIEKGIICPKCYRSEHITI